MGRVGAGEGGAEGCVGNGLGFPVGIADGAGVGRVGWAVGTGEGLFVGAAVGIAVGRMVGWVVGFGVGLVGLAEGVAVGVLVLAVGREVLSPGPGEGLRVGFAKGCLDGLKVGFEEGGTVGDGVLTLPSPGGSSSCRRENPLRAKRSSNRTKLLKIPFMILDGGGSYVLRPKIKPTRLTQKKLG